jgi:hypothetical protein
MAGGIGRSMPTTTLYSHRESCRLALRCERKELREPFWVGQADGVRGTPARTSQEVRAIHLLRWVL